MTPGPRLDMRAQPSMRDRLEGHVSLKTVVGTLTALALAVSLLTGAVKTVASATRQYDQMERMMKLIVHLDSTVAGFDTRLTQLEKTRRR